MILPESDCGNRVFLCSPHSGYHPFPDALIAVRWLFQIRSPRFFRIGHSEERKLLFIHHSNHLPPLGVILVVIRKPVFGLINVRNTDQVISSSFLLCSSLICYLSSSVEKLSTVLRKCIRGERGHFHREESAKLNPFVNLRMLNGALPYVKWVACFNMRHV